MITNEYTVSMTHTGMSPVVKISQYDTGARTLKFYIYAKGNPFDLASVTSAVINGIKSDQHMFSYPMEIGDNYVSINVKEQMSACKGNVLAEIVLSNTDGQIGSANFVLYVEPSPLDSGIPSESDISIIQEGIEASVKSISAAQDAQRYAEQASEIKSQIETIVVPITNAQIDTMFEGGE